MQSHPSWVRGLKCFVEFQPIKFCLSHPSWVFALCFSRHSNFHAMILVLERRAFYFLFKAVYFIFWNRQLLFCYFNLLVIFVLFYLCLNMWGNLLGLYVIFYAIIASLINKSNNFVKSSSLYSIIKINIFKACKQDGYRLYFFICCPFVVQIYHLIY